MRARLRAWRLAWALLGAACSDGASNDPGLRAELYVRDAQFVPGALEEGDGPGPALASVRAPHTHVQPGLRGERLQGALEPDGTSVALGLEHDVGYWIVQAGVPTLEEPELPTFAADLWFQRHVRPGPLTLVLRGVDGEGRFGAARTLTLERDAPLDEAPLLVRLRWDNAADLDVHVREPGGEEIWAGNINAAKAPPVGSVPADPNAWMEGAILDLDSNANCQADGRREENVSWSIEPRSGSYSVHVATASLCGESAAHWSVEVWLAGERIGASEGTALPSDVWDGSRRGAGVLALSFRVP